MWWVLLLVVVHAAQAFSIQDVRRMSDETRLGLENKIAAHVQTQIESVAKSSSRRFVEFDHTREPFNSIDDPITLVRTRFQDFDVQGPFENCNFKNVWDQDFLSLRWKQICDHSFKISW
jgi:hypothetical protein